MPGVLGGRHSLVAIYQLVPGGSAVKNLPASGGDLSSIPGLGRSPREGNDNPLQDSYLGNLMDRGAWWATVGCKKSLT